MVEFFPGKVIIGYDRGSTFAESGRNLDTDRQF